MKKSIVLFVLVASIAILFAGCITLTGTYELFHGASDVLSVDIYNLAEYVEFDLPEDAEPIVSLDASKFEQFCADVQSLKYTDDIILLPIAVDPSWTLCDYVVKITYLNGDTEIIGNFGYQCQEAIDGKSSSQHRSFDDAEWDSLIQRYIN